MNPKQFSPNCKSEPSQAVESVMTAGKITIEMRNQMRKIQSFKYLHYQDNQVCTTYTVKRYNTLLE